MTFLNNLKWNRQLSPDQEQLTDALIQRSRDQLILFSTKAYVTMSSPAADKDHEQGIDFQQITCTCVISIRFSVEYIDPDSNSTKDFDDTSSASQITEEEECSYKSKIANSSGFV